ncbi:aldose 1-epimerase family protein [Clostridium sp. D2Q-11]|uniref:Aldose 1-epimerase family protein n=1 Tax=Anaeromonas frigoriresistens TaxID=2683708 RepID=A0A942UXX6_9FIRM|nr:aldose 1-epimerase family protein [Anaeromonas frigoriresistens]MBS4539006.1 aldose 1-epimerase family protein [Anaeromonas frigoriresistens]
MIQKIKNEFLSISIKSNGAELCSLKSLENNKEYIWQADDNYWGRHAPVLFPIVGCLKEDSYIVDDKNYKMTRHGFARDCEFELLEKQDNKLKYLLKSNEKTLDKYPYKFELYIIYQLIDKSLSITYEVRNKGNKEIYFSIGGHPAFNCDIEKGNKYIEFEKEENLDSYILDPKKGLIRNEKKKILKGEKELLLSYDLFKSDALIFENIRSQYLYIKDDNKKDKIKITIEDFPFLGIWTPEAPFICIEPWYGVADFIDTNSKIEDKKGIQKLGIDKIFKCGYQIEICE